MLIQVHEASTSCVYLIQIIILSSLCIKHAILICVTVNKRISNCIFIMPILMQKGAWSLYIFKIPGQVSGIGTVAAVEVYSGFQKPFDNF